MIGRGLFMGETDTEQAGNLPEDVLGHWKFGRAWICSPLFGQHWSGEEPDLQPPLLQCHRSWGRAAQLVLRWWEEKQPRSKGPARQRALKRVKPFCLEKQCSRSEWSVSMEGLTWVQQQTFVMEPCLFINLCPLFITYWPSPLNLQL